MKDGRFGKCCSDGDRSPFNLDQGQHCEQVLKMGNLRGRVGENLGLLGATLESPQGCD